MKFGSETKTDNSHGGWHLQGARLSSASLAKRTAAIGMLRDQMRIAV